MASNKRDNFKQSIIEKLRRRVADRCSNPDCRVVTCGPSKKSETAVNSVGEAAHITAAAPGGPRYDASMQATQRQSINNAIWLCSCCADRIDKDEASYSTTLLKNWKKLAENKALAEMGKRLPDEGDLVKTLTAALTGQPVLVQNAIGNAAMASESALQEMDPRFIVRAEYKNEQTVFKLIAKENVDGKLEIDASAASSFHKQFVNLIEHGKKAEINTSCIRMTGSKLFEYMLETSRDGKLIISSTTKLPGVFKINIVNSQGVAYRADDIIGTVVGGTKSFSFQGSSCGDILRWAYQMSYEQSSGSKVDFDVGLDISKWFGQPIQSLPYIEKIYSFMLNLMNCSEIRVELEVHGELAFAGVSGAFDAGRLQHLCTTTGYIHALKTVCSRLNIGLVFNVNIEYDPKIHSLLELYLAAINGGHKSNCGNFKLNFTVDEQRKNLTHLLEAHDYRTLQLTSAFVIYLADQSVELPEITLHYDKVRHILPENAASLKMGDELEVTCEPAVDCVLTAWLGSVASPTAS